MVQPSRGGLLETSRDEDLEQSHGALPQNLIRPLPYRITKASGSGDLLSRLPVHAGRRDGVDYSGGASREAENPRLISVCCGIGCANLYMSAAGNPEQVKRGTSPPRTRTHVSGRLQ